MSTLYIRLLSRAAADRLDDLRLLTCPFAVVNEGGAIEREGEAMLGDLAPLIGTTQRVTLLLAASDVSLLRIRVPPMSSARLRAALPNMLEEKLMSDPADCVLVAGPPIEGMRTVAVVQRDWLEQLAVLCAEFGASSLAALPAQLCIPHQEGIISAAIAEHSSDLDLVIRLSDDEGIGMAIWPDSAVSAAQEAVQTLCAVVSGGPVALYVPQASVPAYRVVLDSALLQDRVTLFADNWARWISGARAVGLNLMNGLGVSAGGGIDWRPWRWAIGLGVLLLLVNVISLNVDWLRLKREANALQNGMILTYRATFPKETVIVDPIVQIRQKIALAQHGSGQAAPDDFTALLAGFGDAWNFAMQGAQSLVIAGVEYHDNALLIKLKPDAAPPMAQIKAALTQRHLSLSQQNAGVWQIRSIK